MCPTNDFLPFCPTDTGTNLLDEAGYLAAADRVSGNKPGIASSKLNNKAVRQATYVTSQLAQYMANYLGEDILDDATPAKLLAQFAATLKPYAPKTTRMTSGTGTFNMTYIFLIASGNATASATYTTPNGKVFTVGATISGGIELTTTGTGDPGTLSGTLTKSGGTGDATLTFYAYRRAQTLTGILVAAGGGGGAAGAGTNGSNGSASSFGTTLISANAGSGGPAGNSAGAGGGGAASLGVASGRTQTGGAGGYVNGSAGVALGGAPGGQNPFGGGAPLGNPGNSGASALANTGCGGAGGGGDATHGAGAGGGAGGYANFSLTGSVLTGVAGSFGWAVGAGGGGGTGGFAPGGDGGSGYIEVTEYF